jgi:alpha-beta hydrolase superfamily lysophospholipase
MYTSRSRGVAAVPDDDRGIGASSKAGTDESSVTIDTFIDDAVAWKKYKQDSRFSDFGIIGHSEGSLIGMLASQPLKHGGTFYAQLLNSAGRNLELSYQTGGYRRRS